MTGKNSEPDTISEDGTIGDFSEDASQLFFVDAPSQTLELTQEDVVFLKEFFAELEVEDAQEE